MKNRTCNAREFLLESPWMQSLGAAVQERVIAEAYDILHREGDIVARQGEPVCSWIGVAEGLLKVVGGVSTSRPVIYSSVPVGSWMGEGSVIKNEPRLYDVIAIGGTRTIHVPRATFRWLLESSFEFNHFVISHLNERLGQFMSMVETTRIDDPMVRLARALVGLFNPVLYPKTSAVLTVSQQELGDLAGITRQRTNAALQVLKRLGMIEIRRGAIVVLDLPALKALSRSSSLLDAPSAY
ncbi:Crp/Fnr family transcriptional regulator [Variovorax sp. WS11]|uniref:Crp/Fnr family transcriptional regulator n=1 Tax=Variovorax sp. WS11 TaxID=1105204 RepID=UPI000D0C9765|nr:Crp/Fnr family transcriptional regulator [Variovorax sp. WS11]NDZ18944.1 Crp/Fnr family transcriptional regulator [Variovorax sp. WS11]PSL82452.1 Crp/Fnr family transcriptional regulator [Variovorax sp. WS11]